MANYRTITSMKIHAFLLPIILLIPLLFGGLTACSGGVPQEELDAVNALLQEETSKTADLESRLQEAEELQTKLKQAAQLEAARGLLADGWELPGPQVLAFLAAVQDSDDSELRAGMGELLQGYISGLDTLPPELIGQALAAVQGAGDLQVADAVQGLLFGVAQGGGGPELLVVAHAVHVSQSEPLEDVVSSILSEVLGEQGSADLAQSISALASTSTDSDVQQALDTLRQPSDDFIRQVEEHLNAAGVAVLQDSFREAYLTPDGDPSEFYDSVVEHLRQALDLPTASMP